MISSTSKLLDQMRSVSLLVSPTGEPWTFICQLLFGVSNLVLFVFGGQVDYDIKVTMLEIYNENLRDLLVEGKGANNLDIRSTEKSGLNVPDAVQRSVATTDDVLELMELGTSNRAVGGTKMNNRSSRSHSVLTVVVSGTNQVTGMRTHGCLHLVDLAGSERVGRTEASGNRINVSLSACGEKNSVDQHCPREPITFC